MCDVKLGRLGKFDFNPRGELWCKDENRFGHKFLSKFGWSQGKGLGKNEDGISENLKVRIKNGNTGVGWDEKIPIGIDYREYDAVLEDLSKKYHKSGEMKKTEISLEKRSQQFKNRIPYQKFVRGKDTSRYTEKDMSCIFLSRESEKEEEYLHNESTVTNTDSYPSQLSSEESGPTFKSQMSVADYFAMKMKNKMGSSSNTLSEPKSCEETSQAQTDVRSKKRKHEFKNNKKAKKMKHRTEFSSTKENLICEKDSTESSSSSQETSDDNLLSEERFQNSEELPDDESMKKNKKTNKKMKKLLDSHKSKQNIDNHDQQFNVIEDKSVDRQGLDFEQTLEPCSNSPQNIIEKEVKCKKRKKELKSCKKSKKRRVEEAEIYSNVEKSSSPSESDEVERNSSEECVAKSLKNEKQSRKESRKHKSKLLNFKSCLKSYLSTIKNSFKEKKNVSFSENISYKFIEKVNNSKNNMNSDIVLETNEQLLSCSDEDSEVVNEPENAENNHVDELNLSGKSIDNEQQPIVKLEHSDVSYDENPVNSDEDNTVPECFKLPKCSSTNYDSWLETQRIAARMKVYKSMAKKMKRHPVLRKTNLLEIKGYGNWGF